MTETPVPRRRRLGEILLDAGLLTEAQLMTALSEQRRWGGKLGHTLVQLGYVNEGAMAHALSHQLDLPTIDLDEHEPPIPVQAMLRVDLAEHYGVFPLATSDPTNTEALQELASRTGREVFVMVSSASAIERAIRVHYHGELPLTASAATSAPVGVAQGLRTPTPESSSRLGSSSRVQVQGARDPELQQRVEVLTQQVEELRRMVASQARALHGLVEVLEESGLLDRAEYLNKVRG